MPNPFTPQNDGQWMQPTDAVPMTFGQLERQTRAAALHTDAVVIPRETADSLRELLLSMADTFSKNDMSDIAIQAKAVAALI